MFKMKRRLIAAGAVAALALSSVVAVSAGSTYFYPSTSGCVSTAWANVYRSGSLDISYTQNADSGGCATNVASKALWHKSGIGSAETSWQIDLTFTSAQITDPNFDYGEGRGQVKLAAWGPIAYSGALYP